MDFKPAVSLTQQIANHLSDAIISGRLAPLERIQEQRVAKDLGVSRGSVREALLIVEGRHLIDIVPRRGAVVSGLEPRAPVPASAISSWPSKRRAGVKLPRLVATAWWPRRPSAGRRRLLPTARQVGRLDDPRSARKRAVTSLATTTEDARQCWPSRSTRRSSGSWDRRSRHSRACACRRRGRHRARCRPACRPSWPAPHLCRADLPASAARRHGAWSASRAAGRRARRRASPPSPVWSRRCGRLVWPAPSAVEIFVDRPRLERRLGVEAVIGLDVVEGKDQRALRGPSLAVSSASTTTAPPRCRG